MLRCYRYIGSKRIAQAVAGRARRALLFGQWLIWSVGFRIAGNSPIRGAAWWQPLSSRRRHPSSSGSSLGTCGRAEGRAWPALPEKWGWPSAQTAGKCAKPQSIDRVLSRTHVLA